MFNPATYQGRPNAGQSLSGACAWLFSICLATHTGASTLSVTNARVMEGTSSTEYAEFAVTLSEPLAVAASVDYVTRDGTADSANDYVRTEDTLEIPAGSTEAIITVRIRNSDRLAEPDEAFGLFLSNPKNATFADGQRQLWRNGIIIDDEPDFPDPRPSLYISEVLITEADGAQAEFIISLSRPVDENIGFAYATRDGTAVAGEDYVAANGTVGIAEGELEARIPIAILSDDMAELHKTFYLVLVPEGDTESLLNGQHLQLTGTASIQDDDGGEALPVLWLDPEAKAGESTSATQFVDFLVNLSEPAPVSMMVDYVTQERSASASSDFVRSTGTLEIEAGNSSGLISVRLQNSDRLGEPSEAFGLVLNNPRNVVFPAGQTRLNSLAIIRDDEEFGDLRPSFFALHPVTVEGGSPLVDIAFLLSSPLTEKLTFSYQTLDGSAGAGADFESGEGQLVFSRGQTRAHLQIPILTDESSEPSESFVVSLVPQEGGRALLNNENVDLAGVATIQEGTSGALPTLSLQRVARAAEGTSSTHFLDFEVSLSSPTATAVTVDYVTEDGTAGNSADYVRTMDTLTIPAGHTAGVISIRLRNSDRLGEPDESFRLILSNPANAVFSGGQRELEAVGVIIDDEERDDNRSSLFAAGPTVLEGANTLAEFTFSLSAPAPADLRFRYATADGSAVAGLDYQFKAGELVFLQGQTEASVQTMVVTDEISEPAESFSLVLTPQGETASFLNADIAQYGAVCTILDGGAGAEPVLSIESEVTGAEGTSETTFIDFPVRLSSAVGIDVTVDYATQDGSAFSSTDFVQTSGTLTIPAGKTSGLISVRIRNSDRQAEPAENFSLFLSNPQNAIFSGGQDRLIATGIIIDDEDFGDKRPVVFVKDASVVEGAGALAEFAVELSHSADGDVTFVYSTTDGSATEGADYVGSDGLLKLARGQTRGSIQIPILDDEVGEPSESFSLVLSPIEASAELLSAGADGTGYADLTGTAVIHDNDHDEGLPVLSIDSPTKSAEGTSSTTFIDFHLSLSKAVGVGVTVDVVTVDGSASSEDDYVTLEETLTIPAGSTSALVSVRLRNSDREHEPQESFTLVLSNPGNAVFGGGVESISAEGIIMDDEGADNAPGVLPVLRVSAAPVAEGHAGVTPLVFEVGVFTTQGTAVNASMPIGFQYEVLPGTATEGEDFSGGAGEATVEAGQRSTAITVDVMGDSVLETDETVILRLAAPDGAEFAPGVTELYATGWIANDELHPHALTIVPLGNAQAELRWPSHPLFTYELEASPDLVNWGSEATLPGEDEEMGYQISLDEAPRYFRLTTVDSE